jgi:ribosomal protein S18 acetylase RimI-like enzyme
MPTQELRRLTETDAPQAAAVLARAFHPTALFGAVTPDPADRLCMARALFAANLRHSCRHGEAWAEVAPSGEIRGVTYWVDRPEPDLTEGETAELGYADLAARWGPAARALAALEGYGMQPFAALPVPWRYLAALGVDPAHQGRGLGTTLVTKTVAGAHAAGLRCGLVTDEERNVAFYRRRGFRLVRGGIGPDGSTRLWTMLTDAPEAAAP